MFLSRCMTEIRFICSWRHNTAETVSIWSYLISRYSINYQSIMANRESKIKITRQIAIISGLTCESSQQNAEWAVSGLWAVSMRCVDHWRAAAAASRSPIDQPLWILNKSLTIVMLDEMLSVNIQTHSPVKTLQLYEKQFKTWSENWRRCSFQTNYAVVYCN